MSEQVNEAGLQQNVRSQDQQHNPLLNMRDRLFFALFCRVSLLYSHSIPRYLQRTLEFLLLFEALLALGLFIFIHMAFVRVPVDCLSHVHDIWPKNGILRVEIIKNASNDYTLNDSYRKLEESFHLTDADLIDLHETGIIVEKMDEASSEKVNVTKFPEEEKNHSSSIVQNLNFYLQHLKKFSRRWLMTEDMYVVEYSLEYGLLRLSPKTRNHLNVTVMLVILDPTKDKCFGGWFSQVMLEEFLGYEDVLLSSLYELATKQNNSGFFRNVLSGDNYRFIEVSVSRVSYVTAAFLMIFFTLSISMLLRYAHQQIFLFIVDLLQVFDRNALITFPLAPLLTAVLALIGVEALMSELFTEASTAFYVILIVWLADQYDVICCHTNISRRHWLRFFYLYHFVFYAYHYRFNGHFSSITLATSWLFIQHSMIYFFHHYELPSIVHQARVQNLVLQAQRQSIALPTARRGVDGTALVSQSETSAGQEVNYGAVIAFIPEDSSSQTQSPNNAAEGAGLSNTGTVQRFGQQRQTWSLFNLPAFRFSNSLILAQVFVRHQPESSQQPSERLTQTAAPVSQRTASDEENSNVSNASEAHNQRLAGDIVSNQAVALPCETQQDMELPTDVMNIPWKLEEKMDEDVDVSNESNPVHISGGKDGGEGTNIKPSVDAAVDPAGSFYQQNVAQQPEDQSTTELESNLELLSERSSVASVSDNLTSLAYTSHTCHTIYTNGNSDHSTNQIQELSRSAISSKSEATCSEDHQPPTENGNQTC